MGFALDSADMTPPLEIDVRYTDFDHLAGSSTFRQGRGRLVARWPGQPLVMGSEVRLRVWLDSEPVGPSLVLDDARTGPGVNGAQWFVLYQSAARALLRRLRPAPVTPSHAERAPIQLQQVVPARSAPAVAEASVRRHMGPREVEMTDDDAALDLDASRRAKPRWRCNIPTALEWAGNRGDAHISDVSDTGVKLDALNVVPKAGALLRVQVLGQPGEGLAFNARVAWANREMGSVGLRFLPLQRDEQRQLSDWISQVQLSTISENLNRNFVS